MKPNIVLVVADSLRRDRVGRYRDSEQLTPTIDDLTVGGQQFENAYSTGSWTVPAHGSLFTGMYPSEHGTHCENKHFSTTEKKTLAGQLSELGYETVGFSTNPWITPEFGFADGFDQFYELKPTLPFEEAGDPRSIVRNNEFDSSINQWFETIRWMFSGNPFKRGVNGVYQRYLNKHPIITAEDVLSEIDQWGTDQKGNDPFFMFVNFMDSHEPYRIYDEYIDAEIPSHVPDIEWNLESLHQEAVSQKSRDIWNKIYNGSVKYLDTQIDALTSWLDEVGKLDNTIFIFTSDHGQSLGENGFWGHGTFLYDELVAIPLIVSAPDEYTTTWPDTSTTVSIGELPFYIMSSIGESFRSKSTVMSKRAAKKLQGVIHQC